MSFIEHMKERARNIRKKLVLPEGTELRMIQAARIIVDKDLASKVFLLGKETEIKGAADNLKVSLDGVTIIDPALSPDLDRYTSEFFDLRKHKGITEEEAREMISGVLNFGTMMVRLGDADGIVAGAENSTGNVLRAAFTIIKTAPGTKHASSCFVMNLHDPRWGVDGHMIFSDCATIPDPTPEQLAEIALAASESCRVFLDTEPATALLSFSTKGSADHPDVEKVRQAMDIIKERAPLLNIDGEMQADAAIIPSIGEKKAPGSTVAGKANVLVFPDLNTGNISYKLVQRLAGADAYGPFLQGFAKPVSDLSRGCSVDDIVNTSAVTLVQAR